MMPRILLIVSLGALIAVLLVMPRFATSISPLIVAGVAICFAATVYLTFTRRKRKGAFKNKSL